jgi:hypothetical protein
MKKLLLIFSAILIIYGCQREKLDEQAVDKFNGYESFYKTGEMEKTLWAGQNINVGTATYGIDDDGNFYVTYQTTGDWVLLETHLYAGTWEALPKNKPGNPKIGRFPYSADHGSGVSTYTYTIPLTSLPPCQEPGFIVAAHAAVKNISNGQGETAWGAWDREFCDRRWGGYSNYYYNEPPYLHTLLYGSEYNNTTLNIYLINATDGESDLILSEDIGTYPSDTYDGIAWDPVSNYLFFTTYSEGVVSELMINTMEENAVSISAGTLNGIAQSASFYDGQFYYIDEVDNTINAVTFDSDWMKNGETVVSTIPNEITVHDLAFSPDGSTIYLVGVYQTNTQLISLDVNTDTYSVINISLANDAQIAYGSDDQLYAVSASGTGSIVSSLDPTTGTVIEIGDEDIGGGGVIISDLGRGPVQ